MSALSVDIRRKAFDSAPVLEGLSFSLEPGERAALLGPSGIGKSTLLSLVAGIDRNFEGRVERGSGRLAMVFQTPRLLPWRTLVQNITLIPETGGETAARAILAEMGLAEAADRYPEKVSLGMQRRAALARAIAVNPTVIVMDEPLVSLDVEAAAAMRAQLLAALERTGATALIATHDRREALALADRLIEIDGRPAGIIRDRRSPLARDARQDSAEIDRQHEAWFGADTG